MPRSKSSVLPIEYLNFRVRVVVHKHISLLDKYSIGKTELLDLGTFEYLANDLLDVDNYLAYICDRVIEAMSMVSRRVTCLLRDQLEDAWDTLKDEVTFGEVPPKDWDDC